MALASTSQDDFGAGIHRGREAPLNAVYDAVNVLIDDEGQAYRRAGSVYQTTSDAGETLLGLAEANIDTLGDTTLAWGATTVYRVHSSGTSFVTVDAEVAKPWARGATIGGYWIVPLAAMGTSVFAVDATGAGGTFTYAATTAIRYVATAGQRLLAGDGKRVWFSPRDDPSTIDAADYHEFPSQIIGLDGVGDTGVVFTTTGVWAIENMSLDAIDAYGNIQHVVRQVSRDIILWGDPGVSGFAGTLVVPALDDVFLLPIGGDPVPISAAIRPLYRAYVKAGYQPGTAAVHRGHYFLPILNGNTLVDTLICRLDRGFAWTRWAGRAASGAYTQHIGSGGTRAPKLLSVAAQRVDDLTGTLDPTSTAAADADGTTSQLVIETRDYPTGQHPGFFKTARVRYELEDANRDTFVTATSTLGAPWLAWIGSMPTIRDMKAYDVAGYASASRPESVGPNSFMEAEFEAPLTAGSAGQAFGVGIRLSAHADTADGYMFEIVGTGSTWRPRLYKGAAFTTLATGTERTGRIDAIRLTASGPNIKGYFRIAGEWTEVVTASDATYGGAGYPGFWIATDEDYDGPVVGVDTVAWGALPFDHPAVVPYFTSDADGAAWTELTDRGEQGGADGWAASDGSLYQWATVGKRRERARLRLIVYGAYSRFVLRSIELLVRQSGKQ